MFERIKGQPTQIPSSIVAQGLGRQAVGDLVNDHRVDKDNQRKNSNDAHWCCNNSNFDVLCKR